MALIYGINPVLEALESGGRGLHRLVVAKGRSGDHLRRLLKLAEQRGIDVEFRDRDYLDRQTGRAAHQGVVGIGRDYSYVDVEEIISRPVEPFRDPFILILDSVTDPQNLGSLIRTAACFGANGLVIPVNRAAAVSPAVMKASAGAAHYLPIARVVNIAATIEALKKEGFWIYGAEAGTGKDMRRIDGRGRIGLIMGSEGKGIRPLIKKKCDELISIPMEGRIGSLNVSVAAGIILFEIFSKRARVEESGKAVKSTP